jgi:hypothetical protein
MASIAVLAGCGKKDAAPDSISDTRGYSLLSAVPADTPYVFAALEPVPEDVYRKTKPLGDGMLATYQQGLRQMAESVRGQDEENARMIGAIASLMDPDNLERFGSSRESTAVIYGHGLLPVVRANVEDGSKFRDGLMSLQSEFDFKFEQARAADKDYLYAVVADVMRIAIAIEGNSVLMTAVPEPAVVTVLPAILTGVDAKSSLASRGGLDALARENGFLPYGMGYIDVKRIASTFIDGPTGTDAMWMEALGADVPEFDATCRAEMTGLAGVMPRAVAGYTRLDTKEMNLRGILEMRDDVASGMQPIAKAIPSMQADTGDDISFGMGVDVRALRDFVSDRATKVAEQPFKCAQLTGINQSAQQILQGLQQPVPPMVYNFRGFVLRLNDLSSLDFSAPRVPDSLNARLMLAFDNIDALLALGRMSLPQLAALEIEADGKPVQLPPEAMMGFGQPVFASLTDDLLSVGTGPGAEDDVAKMTSAAPIDAPLFMSISYDVGEYLRLQAKIMSTSMQSAPPQGDAEAAQELLESMQKMMDDLADVYSEVLDSARTDVQFTARGVEVDSTTTFK